MASKNSKSKAKIASEKSSARHSAGSAKKTAAAIQKSYTKAQMMAAIAKNTGLSKKQVEGVFEALASTIERHLKQRGIGQVTIPGLLKIKRTRKPARKARTGTNPFNGQPMEIKARPARNVVKLQALKGLKEMVAN
jgi:Bacterial nucleoid DNA-binding protein